MKDKEGKKQAKQQFKKKVKSLAQAITTKGIETKKADPKFVKKHKHIASKPIVYDKPSKAINDGKSKKFVKSGDAKSKFIKKDSFSKKDGDESKKRKLGNTPAQTQDTDPQRELKKRRQAAKPNFELVENMKSIWNKLRINAISIEEKSQLVKKLVDKMTGHVLQVTLRHDASRFVQCILQYGTPQQRQKILEEMTAKIFEISKTPYGHFVVLKAVTYCNQPEEQKKIIAALKGHFVALGTNVIGARVVESILQIYPPVITRGLKAEFYGSKFTVLLAEVPKTLRELLEKLPEKASSVIDHMRDLVQRLADKGLLEFAYSHHLLWEYAQEVEKLGQASRTTDFINQLLEAAPKLMSTKPGTKVCCIVATHAGAKDRKRMLKSLKGHVMESLLHDSAHLSIMRLVDATDDTVNVQKSLLDEIKSVQPVVKYTAGGDVVGPSYPCLISIAKHTFGRKFLLRLLAPTHQHLEPDEALLFSQVITTSRKSPEMRRKENLTFLKKPLLQVTHAYLKELLYCRAGSKVLMEIVSCFRPKNIIASLARLFAGMDVEQLQLADETQDNDEEDEEEEEEEEEDDDDEHHALTGATTAGEEEEEEAFDEEDMDNCDIDNINDEEEDVVEAAQSSSAVASKTDKKPKSSASAVAAVAPVVEPELPVHEHPVAHLVLKRILEIEAQLEGVSTPLAGSKQVALIKEYWEEQDQADTAGDFASNLLNLLIEGNLLPLWIGCNRSCFALRSILNVPSAVQAGLKALESFEELLTENSTKHTGAKLLNDFYLQHKQVATKKNDKQKTPKKAAKVEADAAPVKTPKKSKK